jgi:hypothetical protein
MAKSKNSSDQKKRSKARTQRIKESKKRIQKLQTEMLSRLIAQEKSKGMYENIPTIDPIMNDEINLDGPSI